MSAPSDDVSSLDEELNSSKLGTKEHWDETYSRELQNYKDHGDIGTVWFGEKSMTRIVSWMRQSHLVTEKSKILDLGCGNGVLLIEMYKQGFRQLVGVDYAQSAVDLAIAIAQEKAFDITFQKGDILESPPGSECLKCRYDVCVDKGTYDAVGLGLDDPAGQTARYISNVTQMLVSGGLLILVSCNWTKDELIQHFSKDFDLHHVIPTPTFQFGGVTGTREAAVVFCRKDL